MRYCLVFFLVFLAFFASSNEAIKSEKTSESNFDSEVVNQDFLNGFKITKEEYERYLFLRDNTHRGIVASNPHPLYLLGAEAKTESEKRRFAKMIARLEFESWERTQEFNRFIQEESIKLFGQGKVVDFTQKINVKPPLVTPKKNSFSFVTYLYVDKNCLSDCEKVFKKEIAKVFSGDTKNLQIIFPEEASNLDMRVWAAKQKLPVELNKSGAVLLRKRIEGDHEIDKYPAVRTELY